MNTEDALEAAKLAAMVGSQLKTIDKYSVERTSNPANKININNFIAQVKNPRASFHGADYLVKPPAGFAPPPPEEYVQSQVPDTSIGSLPSTTTQSPPLLQTMPVATANILDHAIPAPALEQTVNQPSYYPNNESISNKEIASTLKSIDKTLADMLTYMKEKLSNE